MNGYSAYGAGSGSVSSLLPQCDGSEESILDCYSVETYSSYSHSYDVGVICSSKSSTSNIISMGNTIFLMLMSCFSIHIVLLIHQ